MLLAVQGVLSVGCWMSTTDDSRESLRTANRDHSEAQKQERREDGSGGESTCPVRQHWSFCEPKYFVLGSLRRRKRQRKKMAKKTLQSSSFYSCECSKCWLGFCFKCTCSSDKTDQNHSVFTAVSGSAEHWLDFWREAKN